MRNNRFAAGDRAVKRGSDSQPHRVVDVQRDNLLGMEWLKFEGAGPGDWQAARRYDRA